MTDEEFERIKEAEKERLRTEKRLRATLESLKRRNEVQSVVRRMTQGAKRLLEETETLADKVASKAARQAARLEVMLDENEEEASLADAEESLREERADALLRRIKTQEASNVAHRSSRSGPGPDESDSPDDPEDRSEQEPDKTIGRMGDVPADE